MDKDGNPLASGQTCNMKAGMTPANFWANISYSEIYPQCDLVLYRKERTGSIEKLTELERKSKDHAHIVNRKYSMHLIIDQ